MNSIEEKNIYEYIKTKSLLLMKHEGKDYARAGISPLNYKLFMFKGRRFYIVPTNAFMQILNNSLLIAQAQFPDKFGTGNAKDVVEAIYNINPWSNLNDYIETLRKEQFCYIVEVVDNQPQDSNVLRVDLYRKFKDKNGNGIFEFIGGIFHCLKHFSIEDKPLSVGKEINNLSSPYELIYRLIEVFFFSERLPKKEHDNTYISMLKINEKYSLKLALYHEQETNVYFIKTMHKKKNSH